MKIRNMTSIAALAVLVALLALPQISSAQDQDLLLFEGELVGVDPQAETLTVQNSDQEQMTFAYDAETEVQGAEATIQGLSDQTGTVIRVSYADDENPMAKSILVLEE